MDRVANACAIFELMKEVAEEALATGISVAEMCERRMENMDEMFKPIFEPMYANVGAMATAGNFTPEQLIAGVDQWISVLKSLPNDEAEQVVSTWMANINPDGEQPLLH